MRRTPEITLPVTIDRHRGRLPEQLAGQLRDLIGRQVLAPGDPVPSSRALAGHLGISRGSVTAAYDQLLAEGYLSADTGRGTTVNPLLRRVHPPTPPRWHPLPQSRPSGLDLRPGQPWTAELVDAAWRAAWRHASIQPVAEPSPPLGVPALREELSHHLRRMRAVVRDPAQLAVTAGGREGLAAIMLALGTEHRLRFAVEDPGYPSLRRVPERFGAQVIPFPVDRHGLITAGLPVGAAAPDVLLVTPSHQYPLGGSLPIDRRQQLLEWARANRVLIVEDDYDSELRYTSSPLPALAALDDPTQGRVVLLGTLSKTLTPALATGYLALPRWLVDPIEQVRTDLGQPLGVVPQQAMADYLASGALRLHTQRMRQRYRRLRALVVAELRDRPGLRVYPMDGGLHAVVETARDEASVVAELAAAGVRVSPLSQYWSGHRAQRGIVFGFGAVTESDLLAGLRRIAEIAGKMEP